MLNAHALQRMVRSIHQQEGGHQQDLESEDQGGIRARPSGHLTHPETLDAEDKATGQEDRTTQPGKHGKDLERTDKEIVEATHEAQHAVGPEDAVDDDLQHFDVDDHESSVDDDVQHPGDGLYHHLALAQCDLRHQCPTLRWAISAVLFAPQQDISPDAFHIPREPPRGGHEGKEENDGSDAHGVGFGG